MFWYGAFIFLTVYSFTELLDRSKFAIVWELIKNALALSIIYVQKDWFGISAMFPGAQYFLIAYFVLSTLICGWWVYKNSTEDQQSLVMPSKA
jgi:hypothetical protein